MLSNMACSLIEHKRITTTVAKAKELRMFVEPLITKSKTDSTHSRRMVFSTLKQKDAVSALFRDVAPKVAEREGGYTRIIRLGTRQGDAAEMCMMELVDFNDLMLAETKTKTRRSRRGGKKKSSGAAPQAAAATGTATATEEAPKAADQASDTAAQETAAADAPETAEKKKETPSEAPKAPEASSEDKKDNTEGKDDSDAEKKDNA